MGLTYLAKRLLRPKVRSKGLDIVQYRPFLELIRRLGITRVFDVGANIGQYAQELRESGYTETIVSFEPVAACVEFLRSASEKDSNWQIVPAGLGREIGEAVINVPRDTRLSSLLPSAQPAADTKQEVIKIIDLATAVAAHAHVDDKLFLKLDIQGMELDVLRAGAAVLNRFNGIQVELSVSPLYMNQAPMEEVMGFLRSQGFVLWATKRGLYDPEQQRVLEMDGLFLPENTRLS